MVEGIRAGRSGNRFLARDLSGRKTSRRNLRRNARAGRSSEICSVGLSHRQEIVCSGSARSRRIREWEWRGLVVAASLSSCCGLLPYYQRASALLAATPLGYRRLCLCAEVSSAFDMLYYIALAE